MRGQVDGKGQVIDFYYDPLSRLSMKQYQDQDLTTVLYHYDTGSWATDPVGRLTEVDERSVTTQFSYDALGRATKVWKKIDNATHLTQFAYDTLGHVTNIVYPDGDQIGYQYDTGANLSSVSNTSSPVVSATFSGYTALGQPQSIGFGNGARTSLSYEPYTNRLHELKTVTEGASVQDFVYGYDNNGNILGITDNVESTNSQSFNYDWLNRLTSAVGPYGTINYNTDIVGNVKNPPNTANGNYTTPQTLVYDYENRLLSLNGNTFTYDYQGARVKKNDTTYISKLYDFDSTTGVATKHIFAGGRRIASITGSYAYYYHPDHLGSLNIATDVNGNNVQQVSYFPYGEVRTNYSPIGLDLPYKFTGKELDGETGLYYFGARYYDAGQGRFLTPDTIVQSPGNPQTLNRYAYAGNNPLAFVDPTGHGFCDFISSFFESFFAALAGGLVSLVAGPI